MGIIDITGNKVWLLLISQEIKNAWVLLISQGGKKHRHD
jgi:hypothetical protein